MSKHTLGPWEIQRQNPSPTTGEWMIAGATPGYLAEVRDCGSGSVEANARLIAAAPDLLNAAKHALETLDSKHDFLSAKWRQMHYVVFYELLDAITKATGDYL